MGDRLLEGALALNCPGCGTQVADGTSICPKCDYIIDASFLSSDPPPGGQDDDEVTGAGQDPRQAAPSPRPARRAPTASATGRSAPGARSGAAAGKTGSRPAVDRAGARAAAPPKAALEDSTQIKNVKDIAPSRSSSRPPSRPPSRSVPAVRRAPAAAPPPDEEDAAPANPEPRRALLPPPEAPSERAYSPGQIVAPEEVISDARAFVGELTRSDKITFAGAAAIIISCFLPWKETAEDGEILGLLSLGAVSLVGAIGIIAAIAIRVRRTMPSLHPLAPWVLQLGVSIFCIFFTLISIRLASDSTVVASPIGNQMVETSSPSLGVFLALLGAIGALTGSLMGMKERS
ncbi:hypothetical protein [Stigmatella aurantiaca]|uniref:Uncharacterized protein n=1 Tax=Stigmatella aurantiaca (strain DW4/3-1) TaxID=378806 RepID=Q094T2_STIAD|nr:hypothetical protein [Stigmatella aurantiaca]ADO73239.1 uncharacterized protein STAUR_5469 [Stigmatella aurantiaca DW4/3-1]EAU67247.1 hypothetical protein STIAU_7546 [Stigmatella aurantiaca DW4/3-1]